MKLRYATLLVSALIAGATSLLAQSYTVTDLGAVAGQTESAGYGLNDSGQAAGVSETPGAATPTLFSDGDAIDIGLFVAGDPSVATSINGSAEVAGYELEPAAIEVAHAWIFSNGKLTDLSSSSLFPAGTEAFGINDSGEVVGEGELTQSSFHAFVYANGKMTDIGPPGAFQASAVAINDNGQVLGNAFFNNGSAETFIYANGTFTSLTPAGSSTSGIAINSLGEVLGDFNNVPAVFSNGKWTDLAGSVSNASVRVDAINTAGQVVVTAIFPGTYHPFRAGKHVAYIASSKGYVNLNTLIPANSGYTLTDSIAINDAGQILCDASTPTSAKHAVLLTPTK